MSKQPQTNTNASCDNQTTHRCNENDSRTSSSKPRLTVHFFFLAGMMAIGLILIRWYYGTTMVEKMVTSLVMPVGLIWLLLLLQSYFCFLLGRIKTGFFSLMIWSLLTLSGNTWVSDLMIRNLEKPFLEIDPFQMEKLDTVIVLGGGTSSRFSGQSQFGEGGDRVGLAARMFHAGKVERIICTGSASFQRVGELHPREQASEILMSLKIPNENISMIEGINTTDEMKNLKKHFENSGLKGKRVGLITSAFHLPRALRLAKNNGLELIPVPADFRTRKFRVDPDLIIPSASQLAKFQLAAKEYLARLVNR